MKAKYRIVKRNGCYWCERYFGWLFGWDTIPHTSAFPRFFMTIKGAEEYINKYRIGNKVVKYVELPKHPKT